MELKEKVSTLWNNVRTYWRVPMPGRYMTFKEIGAYAFGGIGAYFIIQLGSTLIVSTTNILSTFKNNRKFAIAKIIDVYVPYKYN